MSIWQRIDENGEAHDLTAAEDKAARKRFRALMDARAQRSTGSLDAIDGQPPHIELGARRRDGSSVRLIGMARDLHGPSGPCTCCHGRGAA